MNDERGAVAVIVAISLTVLFGMGALVLDVGALYVEKRELQNGADAAALAIAEACATGSCSNGAGAAKLYADDNASDLASNVDHVDLDTTARTVTVDTSTAADDGDQIRFGFARVFGLDGSTVTASATTIWGAPGDLDVFKMTISDCLFELLTANGTVFDTPRTIRFHDPATEIPCAASNNNQTSPGNWGWLTAPLLKNDRCIADVGIGVSAGDSGNNPECSKAQLNALIGKAFGIPVFSSVTGTGSGTKYTVVGYAGFKLSGYHLGGSLETNPPCGSPERCIAGTFTRFITYDEVIDPAAESFGVSVVKLVA